MGIDVFKYTESHSDKYRGIKTRDVIQIYRVFNTMRDAGRDRVDEIKLSALLDCPFFELHDFERIKQYAFL